MTERQCPLGLNCSQMGLHEGERGDCINEEACDRYTEPWELYEIVILKGLPGAIYLCWYGRNSSGERIHALTARLRSVVTLMLR